MQKVNQIRFRRMIPTRKLAETLRHESEGACKFIGCNACSKDPKNNDQCPITRARTRATALGLPGAW